MRQPGARQFHHWLVCDSKATHLGYQFPQPLYKRQYNDLAPCRFRDRPLSLVRRRGLILFVARRRRTGNAASSRFAGPPRKAVIARCRASLEATPARPPRRSRSRRADRAATVVGRTGYLHRFIHPTGLRLGEQWKTQLFTRQSLAGEHFIWLLSQIGCSHRVPRRIPPRGMAR